MAVPTDDILTKVIDLSATGDALNDMSVADRVRSSMLLAAYFLEYAAYEMALEQSADDVSEIIHMAAKLDKTARRINEQKILSKAGHTSAHTLRKI